MQGVQEQHNPLGYEKIGKLLRQFAIPSIVAMLVSSLYNIVDQIFIGHSVGYLGNAATNVAFPLTTISLAFSLLIGVGSAAYFSIELGKGNKKAAEDCICNALFLATVIGILYAVAIEIFMVQMLNAFGATAEIMPYASDYVRITAVGMPFLIFTNVMSNLIRADGSPQFSMVCMVTGAVVNTILDPILIFGFDKGVAGAAVATVISQIVSCVIAAVYFMRFKQVSPSFKKFRPDMKLCGKQASLGLSNSLNQVALTLTQVVMNNSLKHYGALSVYGENIPLSAVGIVMKINAIAIAVFVGVAQGSQPIIGFNYGAKQYGRVKAVYKQALRWNLFMGLGCLALFQIFPKYLIMAFGSGDALYFEFAVSFLRTYLFTVFLTGCQLLSSNFFSAIGKPLKGVILSLSRQTIFLVPLILIMPLFFGIDGLRFTAPISDTLSFCVCMYFIWREFKRMTAESKEFPSETV